MPCMKCANGKWKYGEHGNCQFDTLAACKAAAAAAAIHIQNSEEADMKPKKKPPLSAIKPEPGPHGPIPEAKDMQPTNPHHCDTCQCATCKGMYPKYK